MKNTHNWDLEELEDWAQMAKDGNRKAFENLYDTMVDGVYAFVVSKVRDHELAEDITAETWKKVWLGLEEKVYKRDKFVGYVFRIAYTTMIDAVRKEARRNASSLNEEISGAQENLVDEIYLKDRVKAVKYAIKKLASPFREILWMRFVEDLSVKETAEALEISQVSVRVYQHRAVKKLKSIVVT